MIRLFVSTYLLLLLGHTSFAAKVDTVGVFSEAMQKEIKTVTILPDAYENSRQAEFPVIYLLHGFSDNYSKWVNTVPHVKQLADQYKLIIICPDGGYGSWYIDSPEDKSYRYETFVAEELVAWADKAFRTIKNRKGRAITGLSMGGHGGLYLGFRHQDVYGAAGSMSGGVDLRPFPENWQLAERLGNYAEYPKRWEANSVINLTHLLKNDHIKIIIDCGVDDFFYDVNVDLHEKLLARNIDHDFISRPGRHNWQYWSRAIYTQVIFFHLFFEEGKK